MGSARIGGAQRAAIAPRVVALAFVALAIIACGDDDAGRATAPSSDAGRTDAISLSDAGGGARDGSATGRDSGFARERLCPGHVIPERPCRDRDDCGGATSACLPGPDRCGGPPIPQDCGAGCDDGLVCMRFDLTSECGHVPACAPPCTATSCGEGLACRASGACEPTRCDRDEVACGDGLRCDPSDPHPDVHGCAPIECTDGFTCAPNETCVAGSSETHGCELSACAEDDDCACGFCIDGSCWPQPFTCEHPPAG